MAAKPRASRRIWENRDASCGRNFRCGCALCAHSRLVADGGPAGGWQPQEKISLDDCIRAYTTGSAYAQFEEGRKGALVTGQYADFIVLSADLTKIPPAEYTKTHVLRTVVGGRTVYESK